ncbi:MAG: M4 family metallopeptidase [Deltaproteobacteria bacterium]|nr:M4 family metallopeptidase [Deltaproteobacteria bacterium]
MRTSGCVIGQRVLRACAAAVLGALWFGAPPLARAEEATAVLTAEQQSDFAALSVELGASGEAPQLWLDDVSGTPRRLLLRTPARVQGGVRGEDRSPASERRAREFLSDHRRLFRLTDPDAELRLVKAQVDEASLSHLRFEQRYRGVPFWAREVIVHLDAQGLVYLVQGQTVPTPEGLDVVPVITAAAAVEAACDHLGLGGAPLAEEPGVDLVFFVTERGTPSLAYRIEVVPGPAQSWTFFVDAGTGAVLKQLTNLRYGQMVPASGLDLGGRLVTFRAWLDDGVYYLLDPTRPRTDTPDEDPLGTAASAVGTGFLVVGDAGNKLDDSAVTIARSESASGPWDPAAVSAMVSLARVSDYFLRTFGRAGYDGAGMSIRAAVHFGDAYANAFWNSKSQFLNFGDGDATFLENPAGCLDVVAHEFAHAVTEHSTNLVYEGQSGALNESYSDFFAAMVDRDDWTMGEGCVLVEPGFVRDMADPHRSLGWQPAKLDEYQRSRNDEEGDWGGVHANSGISNRAGYLLAQGLASGGSDGRDRAEKIVFKGLTDYLTPAATFLDARNAWAQAAGDLYGPAEVAVANAAWEAVNVRDVAPLGKMWGGAGTGAGVGSCFVTVLGAGRIDPRIPLALDVAAAAFFLGRRRT